MQIVTKREALHHFKLKDKFECAMDYDGIIWIKQKMRSISIDHA